MEKFKTVNLAKTQTLKGELRVLEKSKKHLQRVELWLLNSEVNRNNWQYLNLEAHKKLFAQTPILIAYVGNKIGDGHNMDNTRDENGTLTPSFMSATAERIVGYFDNEEDIRIEERNGTKWVVGTGYLWEWYAKELVKKLKKQGLQGMSVSIEALIDKGYIAENGVEVFTDYQILGTTILGDDVHPAIADASIRALSLIKLDELQELTRLRVAQQLAKIKEKGVKKAMVTIKELQAKLPDVKILAASGEKFVMLSADNELTTCKATKNDKEEIVIEDKIVLDSFECVSGDVSVSVPASILTATMRAEHQARVNAESELDKVKTAEKKRRIKALTERIDTRLAEINENRDNPISDEIVADLKSEKIIEEYAEKEDEEGNFVGEEEICKEIDAKCMNEILKADKKLAEIKKNAAGKSYVFDENGQMMSNRNNGQSAVAAAQRLAKNNKK